MLRASPPLLAFLCLCYALLCLCSSARICSTPLRFFAPPCLCISQVSQAYLCLCMSVHICAFALLNPAPQFLCGSSPRSTLPLPSFSRLRTAVAIKCYAFAMHSRAARICSTPLPCLAAHTTPSLAFAFRHEALHCLCFAYRGKSDPSDLRLSTPLRCAFQLSLAFAPRCTAVTTCAPAEQTCQHNAVAELCAHIRAFANHIIAVADQILSMQCRCSVEDVKGEAALAAVSPLADAAQNAVVQPLQNRILERFVHE